MKVNKIYTGGCLEVLKGMPDESVDMCMTSPPYWALRDYGVDGQLGLEPTFQEYINKLCDIFDEVKRVLKKSGTCWVNMGDTYFGGGNNRGGNFDETLSDKQRTNRGTAVENKTTNFNWGKYYPNKALCQIPSRFAIEMSNRGWILRNEIIWHKPNCMPSSVKDRFTVDFEKIFFFVKNKKYWFETQYEPSVDKESYTGRRKRYAYQNYDVYGKTLAQGLNDSCVGKVYPNRNKRCVWKYEGVNEAAYRQGMHKDRGGGLVEKRDLPMQKEFVDKLRENFTIEQVIKKTGIPRTKVEHWFRYDDSGFAYPTKEDWEKLETELFPELTAVCYETDAIEESPEGKIKRTVWTITTKPFKEAHFATYPEALVETPIKAGCPVGGVVLDPFFGAGTTGVVAKKLGRDFVGIELNPEYVKIAEARLNSVQERFI